MYQERDGSMLGRYYTQGQVKYLTRLVYENYDLEVTELLDGAGWSGEEILNLLQEYGLTTTEVEDLLGDIVYV